MCGIAGIISKKRTGLNLVETARKMSESISHRGPDGEGFLVVNENSCTPYSGNVSQSFERTALPYIPKKPLPAEVAENKIVFAHRRLSIIDLSESGHQPMCDHNGELWLTFNGEIYNYKELREQLILNGHQFVSQSDSEVIIASYKEWGPDCVKKFNGMWSFCIYDHKQQTCFASRDRLGVKPFYYVENKDVFAFASEQKAFVRSRLITAKTSESSMADYLLFGQLEHHPVNFFESVQELLPGCNLIYNLREHSFKISRYFVLDESINLSNDKLKESDLIEKISVAVNNAVRLRLRSDVEVGTCLSGGIDSSALAVTMSAFLNKPIHCFTSIFSGDELNEEKYADAVTKQINAFHHKIEPSFEDFLKEADDLIYSQDVPIWSTSTYAQHKVMQLAKKNNIKVVLDGQGADELFAGYHHHFIAKWNNLVSAGKYSEALKDISRSGKSIPNPLLFYLKEKIKGRFSPGQTAKESFFTGDLISAATSKSSQTYFNNVNDQLKDDILHSRLKIFLKCEDRCGMWHGVESRTPFSDDIDLINLAFSFDGNKKIQNGTSKYLLRETLRSKLPKLIYERNDKMGFETPMKKWMVKMKPQLINEILSADLPFVKKEKIKTANFDNITESQLIFKLFVLARWKKLFSR